MIEHLESYFEKGLLHKQTHPILDLTIWNYTPDVQLGRLWDDITIQCRGLVTNSKGTIVARPFKKFFNLEEHDPTDIPNQPFDVYEKMDGSLGILFYYENTWVFASRGSFTSEYAEKGREFLTKSDLSELNINNTYLFEIIYKENKIVCDYDFDGLVLLSAFETSTGEEVPRVDLEQLKTFDLVKKYHGFDDYHKLKGLIAENMEGFVLRFQNGFRMKIKGEWYVQLHSIVTKVSNKTIWEYLKEGKSIDVLLETVPDEFYNWIRETESELLGEYKNVEKEYKEIFDSIMSKDHSDKRDQFAFHATKIKRPGILFLMYDGKDYSNVIWERVCPKFSRPFFKQNN